MSSTKMKSPKRIYMGSVDVDCAEVLITTPESLKKLSFDNIVCAGETARKSPHRMGHISEVEGASSWLKDHDDLPSCQLVSMPDASHQEIIGTRLMGVMASTNSSDGRWPIYAEMASDESDGVIRFKAITIWFGFGGNTEELLMGIVHQAGLSKSNIDDDENTGNGVELLAYQYGVDLDQFTDPSVALKAIELACGVPLAEALDDD